jgi:hypothetical protein
MSPSARKLIRLLEARFGVQPDLAGHLAPILERFAEQNLSPAEWEEVLGSLAAAYQLGREPRPTANEEVRILVNDFLTEFRKIDESLKVLSVYLERIRQRLDAPGLRRTFH